MAMLTINSSSPASLLAPPSGFAKGLIPRNFATHPVGYSAHIPPFSLPLIPESEWQDRINEQVKNKSSLVDIRDRGMGGQRIPSRDQNGRGYCWAHSAVSAALLVRAADNQVYSDLSAYAVACIIKNYRDEGGWGSESVEWIAENGVPSSEFWPQKSVDRGNDNAAMRSNAKLHRFMTFMDLDPRDMKRQMTTCLLQNIPLVCDYNRWSHSVAGARVTKLNPYTHTIWNSWDDSWSQAGMGDLEGDSWLPNAAVAVLIQTPSNQ